MSEIYKDEPLIKELYDMGKVLNDYDDIVMADIIRNCGDCSWKIICDGDEKPTCAIFHEGHSNSTMFKSLDNTLPYN